MRIDLADVASLDLEGIVLRLRGGLAGLGDRFPAFDLAFHLYWAMRNPGVPVETVLERDALREVGKSVDVRGQFANAIEMVADAGGSIAKLAARGSSEAARLIRDLASKGRVAREFDLFAAALEETDPDILLRALPALLAYDLDRIQRGTDARAVVFLDTFEAAQRVQDDRPERGQIEDLLSQVVWLMPNLLVVITGRDRLAWSDPGDRGLLYGGPDRWPGLEAAPRQPAPAPARMALAR